MDKDEEIIKLKIALDEANAKLIAARKSRNRGYTWTSEGMVAAFGGDWVYRHGEFGLDEALHEEVMNDNKTSVKHIITEMGNTIDCEETASE
jgi:hypothetical protein